MVYTDVWNKTYKIRGTVESSINHFKNNFCLVGRKTHADLIHAGITQLISVLLTDKIH